MTEEIKKPKPKPVERVTILESHKEKLAKLADQANDALQGIATITKSDIINLFLKDHPEELSKSEIEDLKAEHFNDVKFAQWMAAKLKQAKDAGENLTLQDLLERSQPLLSNIRARPTRRTRKKKEKSDAPEDEIATEGGTA